MRACVTGATGFIGAALVRRLLRAGVSVRAFARPSGRADELEASGVEVVRGDLRDAEAIGRAVDGADVVYHTAAMVEGPGSREDFVETNVEGTRRLLEACERYHVPHVVYLSSIAVYGLVQKGERIDELTPWDESQEDRDAYSYSKILADQLAYTSNVPVTILRPGIVYGPGRPLPVALLGFRIGKLDVAFGSRQNRIPLTYVENLVDAMLLVSDSKGQRMRRYIVIDDDHLTLGQYHRTRADIERTLTLFLPGWPVLLGAITGAALIFFVSWGHAIRDFWGRQVRRALQDRWYDTHLIREETGWAPKVPLREAIEQTIRPDPGNR